MNILHKPATHVVLLPDGNGAPVEVTKVTNDKVTLYWRGSNRVETFSKHIFEAASLRVH